MKEAWKSKAWAAILAAAMLGAFCARAEDDDDDTPPASWSSPKFMALCYHNVPARMNVDDRYAVNIFALTAQIEFMRAYGCHFIGVGDILEAATGGKPLPDKAVLMTFDDAYETFYTNVAPLLKLYGCPSVLSVVSEWIDSPPQDPEYNLGLMSWAQLKELSDGGLVEIASHSYNSHKAVLSNPQGNTAPALANKIYNPETRSYESEKDYTERLSRDISKSYGELKRRLGKAPRVMTWPYGRYTGIAVEEAQKAGFELMMTLDDGLADAKSDIKHVPRHMLDGNPSIASFAKDFKLLFSRPIRIRALQTDLDLIYDPDPVQQERNLDKFIDRMYSIRPSTVYLQAYCDDGADGNVKSVYFPNRVLPMKADLFNRVARCLSLRGIEVYAWMPMLAISLPDAAETERLRVMEFRDGKYAPSSAWYKRLSPFSPEAVAKLETLYEDLAAAAVFNGVIFQDDGYLNDHEDFHPDARAEYAKIAGPGMPPFESLSPEQKDKWTDMKTAKLIELTSKLEAKVARYRPQALFARTIYAPVISTPESEEWFAQSYEKCLESYDYTVAMCYPRMENVWFPERWLKSLVRKAKERPNGLQKTVFKVQGYDWAGKEWVGSGTVRSWLRALIAEGALNVAYYPDDYTVDQPRAKQIKLIISAEDFPYKK